MNHLTRRAAAAASLLLMLAPALRAQEAPKPTTRPATAEERAQADAYAFAPTDQPTQKRVWIKQDGSPREDFGQPDAGFMKRHEQFLERAKQPVGVVFIGDSITHGWENQKEIWEKAFGPYQPANFGIGGDRTEHVLWRLANGELDNIKPKVAVIMIGTNNWYRDSADIVKGTTAVVRAVQAKLPETKVLLLSIFPRNAQANDPIRLKLQGVNAELAKLDDGEKVRYFELWNQFLQPDGTLTRETMPDLLHLSPAAYQIWADAITPILAEMTK